MQIRIPKLLFLKMYMELLQIDAQTYALGPAGSLGARGLLRGSFIEIYARMQQQRTVLWCGHQPEREQQRRH